MQLDEVTTQYDADFQRVESLTWLPWVGKDFPKRPLGKRLFVVGESHYCNKKTPELSQAECERSLKSPNETREMVSQTLVHREWTTPTLTKIPKLLFKTTDIDRHKLWSDSCYYNFIQRPMLNIKQRPASDDFTTGWKVFAEVVKIIQPSHCIFIGVSAANHFNFGSISCTQQVSRTWARVAKLDVAGKTIELIFVQHLGKYFSWSKWHDYLQSNHTDFMSWLGVESYPNNQT